MPSYAPVNLPNSITLARISCVPLFLWTLVAGRFHAVHGRQELIAAAIFVLASSTDGIDGALARRFNQVTTLGTLLSPLADKLLVSAAYVSLARFAPAMVPAWIAVLIVGREFLVTGLSSVAAQEGFSLHVREIGKIKTIIQTAGVVSVLMAHAWPVWMIGSLQLPGTAIATAATWLMLAFSLMSASVFLRTFLSEAMARARQPRTPHPVAIDRPEDRNVRAT